ncbi:DUF1573 domain-containing protein [Algoriphagus marinus]|uniref:DUF1573 domain-containing protein n=1 Tax=Algoriphagus marinus TaxID=1925762 RepID=UPI0015881C5A|nr:DUF1573 domain-containing protein [Algoriphagus marinus]
MILIWFASGSSNSKELLVEPKVKLVIEKDKNELGEIVAEFQLINSGAEPINIFSVSPHCSCTDYTISSLKVNSDKSETLSLTVPWDQLKTLGEVYAVIKTDSKQKFLKVSVKAGSE